MIKPTAFELNNPQEIFPNMFKSDLIIDRKHIGFVEQLPYVSSVEDFTIVRRDYFRIWFDQRYLIDDAWLELYSELESQTAEIDLSNIWNTTGNEEQS